MKRNQNCCSTVICVPMSLILFLGLFFGCERSEVSEFHLGDEDVTEQMEQTEQETSEDGDLDLLPSDGDSEVDSEQEILTATRSFKLSFTTWPYNLTLSAILDTHERIRQDGDLVTQHFMGGVPWQQAYEGSAYHYNIEKEICDRLHATYPDDVFLADEDGKCYAPEREDRFPIVLALDSLSSDRTDLAEYWDDQENLPRSDFGDWGTIGFADQKAADAFSAWAIDMIARFKPVAVNYGTECSDLMHADDQTFSDFVLFASRVYPAIKQVYPDLPVMVSIALKHPAGEQTQKMKQRVPEVLPYTDILGVSMYPYIFFGHANAGNPDNLPEGWFSQAVDMANRKPLAITETAWIAEDLKIDEYSIDLAASAAWQNEFLHTLFNEADKYDVAFITWFSIVDFDALWEAIGQNAIAAIWRDTGLYDETLTARPALETWRQWRSRPLRDSSK